MKQVKQAKSSESVRRRVLPGRPRLGEAEQITEHVMRVGMAMFLDKGFANSTIDAIALKARISKATFYSRFRSKEALLEACIADFGVRMSPQRPGKETMALPFEQRVDKLSDHILDLIVHPETIGLERLATAESYRFPQVARIANEMGTERALAVLRWFFDDAIKRGDLAPVDTTLLAQMYMDLLFGFLRRSTHGLVPITDREAIWGRMRESSAILFGGLRRLGAHDSPGHPVGDRRRRIARAAPDHRG